MTIKNIISERNQHEKLTLINFARGGLGNQLFQYVFARSLANKLGAELKTDESYFNSDPYGRKSCIYSLDPCAQIVNAVEFAGADSYLLQDGNLESIKDPLILPGGARVLILSGYWQNEKLLDPMVVQETYLQIVNFAMPRVPTELAAKIIAASNSIAVHVRRSDYTHMGLCKESYYCTAIEKISQSHPSSQLFVFTDEPNFVRHWMTCCGLQFDLVGTGDDIADLYLMSLCKHFVIANSSYSWWGALFGESHGSLIFCPSEWVTIDTIDVMPSPCPSRWMKIENAVTEFRFNKF